MPEFSYFRFVQIPIMRYLLLFFFLSVHVSNAQYRPAVFFREDFKETPAEIPINQNHISNSNLKLKLYGPGKDLIKKSNHDKPEDDPFYVWSGLCEGNWALSFEHSQHNVDLSSYAKIKWRSKQSGFRSLRLILKLESGNWIIGDISDGPASDWREFEIIISDISWRHFDIEKIIELKPAQRPDLSAVLEIGFTDLMPGGGSDACSRLDWIEVWGFEKEKK